ncbi:MULTISPECIES: NAD(P)-dependent oxidoreductase [Bradyrhizobium]|jgi:phosphoglycerate dehydrogenase-like enzyme|uniref:NAD(P)-dependent oxidoreductase n=1 Tax=Bradyrhizobium TaxID=374 RepID=UPI000684F836|nr:MULTISPECIES: NAD(P)-dependent oxidoreductase [Bradyrhizobium]MCS3451233.1 phosphoglycerate dehydrogenase-like enzyme [Bradyrhizobium elkanii]MCS3566744.1 phosphoglycerate dehydrogenase-like enzyme [Bradyrhizobium elkanii]MCW2152531.1 phosphoglycerate dehydrogenase-like enzyme [Bradyrhizobium elkanii]MCW2357591.1 phosphoglycerate dehydrogenase-like enzyme [Bradyrhizobium elkanii]MCW2376262.1 phosphoglycerate dehydrogenase-like enzyme [Bradyrhizobium elkanii]
MNTPRIDNGRPVASVRSPIIVNQLGADVRASLAEHWSRPLIIDHPADRPAWEIAQEADVLLTRPLAGWSKAPAERPAGWPYGLRWIQTASTGVDFFPAWLLDGPVVTVGRGISADAIAEYVLAAILGFAKRIHEIRPRNRQEWKINPLGSLRGKTVGIAGFGAIGHAVAERLKPFGVEIRVLRRSSWRYAVPGIVPADSIEALVAAADHLVIALPATPETVHLINADVLARAKPSLHLINVARGRIIDQQALLRALDNGQLAGATLDVTDPEPPRDGDPIYDHPKVVLTPHVSWTGADDVKRLADKTLVNLDAYAHGAPLADVFDRKLGY